MMSFVGNWRCSRALYSSTEAACVAEARLLVTQTIITHFTSLL